jgi:hypothetical protein
VVKSGNPNPSRILKFKMVFIPKWSPLSVKKIMLGDDIIQQGWYRKKRVMTSEKKL